MLKQTEKNDSINRLWRKDGPLKQLLDLMAERIAAELHAWQTDDVKVAHKAPESSQPNPREAS